MAKAKPSETSLDVGESVKDLKTVKELKKILVECEAACRGLKRDGLRLADSLKQLKQMHSDLQGRHGREEIVPAEKLEKLREAILDWEEMYHAVNAAIIKGSFDKEDEDLLKAASEKFFDSLQEVRAYHGDVIPSGTFGPDPVEPETAPPAPVVAVAPPAPEPVIPKQAPAGRIEEKKSEVELKEGDFAYYYRGRQKGEEIYEQVLVESLNSGKAHCRVFDRGGVKGEEEQEYDIDIRKLSAKVPLGTVVIFLPDNMRQGRQVGVPVKNIEETEYNFDENNLLLADEVFKYLDGYYFDPDDIEKISAQTLAMDKNSFLEQLVKKPQDSAWTDKQWLYMADRWYESRVKRREPVDALYVSDSERIGMEKYEPAKRKVERTEPAPISAALDVGQTSRPAGGQAAAPSPEPAALEPPAPAVSAEPAPAAGTTVLEGTLLAPTPPESEPAPAQEPTPEPVPAATEAPAERTIKLLDWKKCGEYRFYQGQTVVLQNKKRGLVAGVERPGRMDVLVVRLDEGGEEIIFANEIKNKLAPTLEMKLSPAGGEADVKANIYQSEINRLAEALKKYKKYIELIGKKGYDGFLEEVGLKDNVYDFLGIWGQYQDALKEFFEARVSEHKDFNSFAANEVELPELRKEVLNELRRSEEMLIRLEENRTRKAEARARAEEAERAQRAAVQVAPAPAGRPVVSEARPAATGSVSAGAGHVGAGVGTGGTVASRVAGGGGGGGGESVRPTEARAEEPKKFKFGGVEYTVGEVRKIMTVPGGEKEVKIIGLLENAGQPQIKYAILDKHGKQAGISTVDEENWKEFVLFDLTDLEIKVKPPAMPAQPEAPGQPAVPEINIPDVAIVSSPPSRKRTGSGRLKKWLIGAGAALGIASLGAAGGVGWHEHNKGEKQEEKIGREKNALETLKQQMLERLKDFVDVDIQLAGTLSGLKEKIKNTESFNEPNFFAGMSPEEATLFNYSATGNFLGKARGIDENQVYADGSTAFIFAKDGRKFLGASNTILKVVEGEFVGWYMNAWHPFVGKFTDTGGVKFEIAE